MEPSELALYSTLEVDVNMDADIARAIQLIDAKIESLRAIRDQLSSLFGNAADAVSSNVSVSASEPATATRNGTHRVTRKDEVASFIRQRGPSSRADILRGTGIPEGTIAFCLGDKDRFHQLEDGRWTNVEDVE
jgi:hypothetical protein